MDTFRTPLSPPPQVLRTLKGAFFLKAPTSNSQQLKRKSALIIIFGETYTFEEKLKLLITLWG